MTIIYYVGGPKHGEHVDENESAGRTQLVHITRGQVPHFYVRVEGEQSHGEREFYALASLTPLDAKRLHDSLLFAENKADFPRYATDEAAQRYQAELATLCEMAHGHGIVLTIDHVPGHPLGMRNYTMKASARPIVDPR